MVTTNINAVLTLMQQKQIQYFKIFDATGKNLAYIQDDEELTAQESYNELSEYLKNLEAGIVTIQLSEKSFKDKNSGGNLKSGNYNFRVRVGNTLNTPQPTISGLNEDYKDLLRQNYELQNKIMILEHERKADEITRKLEEKIEGLKNEDVLEKYIPLIAGFMNKFTTTGQIAQQPVINGVEDKNDKKSLITNAINRLVKIDKNLAENLNLLADFGEKNPEKYHSFIPMLKVM